MNFPISRTKYGKFNNQIALSLKKFTYGISYQQAGFAHTAVSNQEHFEQVITIEKKRFSIRV